jgi:cytochrome c2
MKRKGKEAATRLERMDVSPRCTSEAPKGDGVFYQCTKCFAVIPCSPPDNMGCQCGNIFIDIDCFRLDVQDFRHFVALKRMQLKE